MGDGMSANAQPTREREAVAQAPQRSIWVAAGKGMLGSVRQQQMSWPGYVKWMQERYVKLTATKAAYAAMSPDEKHALKKQLTFSVGAKYRSNSRKAEALELRETVNIDIDKQAPEVYEAVLAAARQTGYAFVHVGSSSNEVNGRRSGRLIFPLNRSVEPRKEFSAVSRKLAEKLGIESIDPVSHRVNQICYAPARCSDASEVFEEFDGPCLDVNATLAEYADWQDPSQWPRAASEGSVFGEVSKLGDPRDRPGLIGAFNRSYDFVTAIETFDLPYAPTDDEWRWTPHDATSSGGARLYPPPNDSTYFAWMYNEHQHGLSPKRNIHAYDAVRLSKFGRHDEGLPDTTPVKELPSMRAMDKWIREKLPKVAAELAVPESEFSALPDEPGSSDQPKKDRQSRFKPVPVGEFSDGPGPEWIVDGVLPRSELAVIYGESGCGKSFFATDMAAAVARGVPWQGRETKQGKVVYVCGESPGGFRKRFQAYAHHHKLKLNDLDESMFLVTNAPDLCKREDVSQLCAELHAVGPLALIVIDTLARATPGANENSGEDMGKALKHCQKIHQETGALVVLIHHSGKDQARGARGWSGIRAATDTEIEVTRPGVSYRLATLTKQRDGEDGTPFGFELVSEVYGVDAEGRELSSLVVKPAAVAAGRPNAKPLSNPRQIVVFKTLKESGGLLGMDDLLMQVSAKLPHDLRGKDRRREVAVRAVEQLRGKGLVAITNDFVSITDVAAEKFTALEEDPAPKQVEPTKAEAEKPAELAVKARPKKANRRKAKKSPEARDASRDDRTAPAVSNDPVSKAEPQDVQPKAEPLALRDAFMERLDVDAGVADVLVREGFSTIEQVANVPESELSSIEELDEEIVKELQTRARTLYAGESLGGFP
ncbi:MAG: AAA family ATPase [Steroidobacteraceae bacterium]